ncbi:MAG TPA: SH3 domain-containing protein [Anaerolineae bacterium]|jgi:uncharacterized protein YgiM (DUF1202 family)
MNKTILASALASAILILSACGARDTTTTVPTIAVTVAVPILRAVTPTPPGGAKSALPAGGDVVITPTATVTGTTPITLTNPISPSTNSPTTGQKNTVPFTATNVISLTTKGTINIRSGPGLNYRVVGYITRGKSLDVTGTSLDKKWWRVKCLTGDSENCWVIADTRYLTPNK